MTFAQVKRFRELIEDMSQGKTLNAEDYTLFLTYCRAAANDAANAAGSIPCLEPSDIADAIEQPVIAINGWPKYGVGMTIGMMSTLDAIKYFVWKAKPMTRIMVARRVRLTHEVHEVGLTEVVAAIDTLAADGVLTIEPGYGPHDPALSFHLDKLQEHIGKYNTILNMTGA